MYGNEKKKEGLQRIILFVEIFAFVKRFNFLSFTKVCKLLNET